MPGRQITDHQMELYMRYRKTDRRALAAAKAGGSAGRWPTGSRRIRGRHRRRGSRGGVGGQTRWRGSSRRRSYRCWKRVRGSCGSAARGGVGSRGASSRRRRYRDRSFAPSRRVGTGSTRGGRRARRACGPDRSRIHPSGVCGCGPRHAGACTHPPQRGHGMLANCRGTEVSLDLSSAA